MEEIGRHSQDEAPGKEMKQEKNEKMKSPLLDTVLEIIHRTGVLKKMYEEGEGVSKYRLA